LLVRPRAKAAPVATKAAVPAQAKGLGPSVLAVGAAAAPVSAPTPPRTAGDDREARGAVGCTKRGPETTQPAAAAADAAAATLEQAGIVG